MSEAHQLARHFLAALAYRTQKAVRGAPAGFAAFRAGNGTRSPQEIVCHMTSVLGYARAQLVGGTFEIEPCGTWEAELSRFHAMLGEISELLADGATPRDAGLEELLQGPFADAMTHAGQLAMLRRLHAVPVEPENFMRARIDADNVGSDQPEPASPGRRDGRGADPVSSFYDSLSDRYHLIFEDWGRSIERQAEALERVIRDRVPSAERALDCTCGIGTQVLGLGARGFRVVGSDLSRRAVRRARKEAAEREVGARFLVSDVRALAVADGAFDVVVALDNALPHLDGEAELRAAVGEMARACCEGGLIAASLRDYGPALQDRPALDPPRVWGEAGSRRLTFQVWSWVDERRYDMLHVIGTEVGGRWSFDQRETTCRAIRPGELAQVFGEAGLERVEVLDPQASGYYQPLVVGRRG